MAAVDRWARHAVTSGDRTIDHGAPARRAGLVECGDEPFGRFGEWALGTAACVIAQVSNGPAADDLYREAIDRPERTDVRQIRSTLNEGVRA